MARKKNREWNCGKEKNTTIDQAKLAVLMDIRDELKELNATLNCWRFQNMPSVLERIDKRLLKNGMKLK